MRKKNRDNAPVHDVHDRFDDVPIDSASEVVAQIPAPSLDPFAELMVPQQVAGNEWSSGAHDELTVQHPHLPYRDSEENWRDFWLATTERVHLKTVTVQKSLIARLKATEEIATKALDEGKRRLSDAEAALTELTKHIETTSGRLRLAVVRDQRRLYSYLMYGLIVAMILGETGVNTMAIRLLNVADWEALLMGTFMSILPLAAGFMTGQAWVHKNKPLLTVAGSILVTSTLAISIGLAYLRIQMLIFEDSPVLESAGAQWIMAVAFFAINMGAPPLVALIENTLSDPLRHEYRDAHAEVTTARDALPPLIEDYEIVRERVIAATDVLESLKDDLAQQLKQVEATAPWRIRQYDAALLAAAGNPAVTSGLATRFDDEAPVALRVVGDA